MVSTVHRLTTYLTLTVNVFVLSSITSSSDFTHPPHSTHIVLVKSHSNHSSPFNVSYSIVPSPSSSSSSSLSSPLSLSPSPSFLSSPPSSSSSSPSLPHPSPFSTSSSSLYDTSGQEHQTNRIYQQGSTLAMVSFVTSTKELTYCVIYDMDKDRDIVLTLFKLYYESILYINIDDMIRLIDTCRDVDMKRNPSQYHPPSFNVPSATGRSFVTSSASRSDTGSLSGITIGNFTEMWTGMVPGTKWCGLGDSASNYFDLGSKGIVDSCCRAHDLCPIRLRPFRRGYGLGYNFSIYTKSYCTCDDSFYHCLKSTNSTMADMIGNFYFNFMKFGCLEPTSVETGPLHLTTGPTSINTVASGNNHAHSIAIAIANGINSGAINSHSGTVNSRKGGKNNGPQGAWDSYSGMKKSKSLKEVKLRVNYSRNLRY